MRIVAGKHRSRTIHGVDSKLTRATLDKVKESIFQRIGPYFDGGVFLDLFAGSGNMGLEAISRGIDMAYFVDNQAKAIETIQKNIKLLREEERSNVMRMSYKRAISILLSQNIKCDVIYLDPPYDFDDYNQLLVLVTPLLKPEGILLVEVEDKTKIETPPALIQSAEYEYPSMKIIRYEKNKD